LARPLFSTTLSHTIEIQMMLALSDRFLSLPSEAAFVRKPLNSKTPNGGAPPTRGEKFSSPICSPYSAPWGMYSPERGLEFHLCSYTGLWG
jgi:hypothetical protein